MMKVYCTSSFGGCIVPDALHGHARCDTAIEEHLDRLPIATMAAVDLSASASLVPLLYAPVLLFVQSYTVIDPARLDQVVVRIFALVGIEFSIGIE